MECGEGAAACGSCGVELPCGNGGEGAVKRRFCRMAIAAFVLAMLSIVTCFATMPFAVMFAIASLVWIRMHRGELRGMWLAVASLFVCLGLIVGAFVLWAQDAEPIDNDYSVADLRSAPDNCVGSYGLLCGLTQRDAGTSAAATIGLSEADGELLSELYRQASDVESSEALEQLRTNRDRIHAMWAASKGIRQKVRRLNEYTEIADLADPNGAVPSQMMPVFLLGKLYVLAVRLEMQSGDFGEALDEFLEFDSVIRKLVPNARIVITRVVCWTCIEMAGDLVNTITNNPATHEPTLVRLAEHFAPMSEKNLSIRNSVIWEYLFMKRAILEEAADGGGSRSLLLKQHSLVRLYRNYIDTLMPEDQRTSERSLSVWPEWFPLKPAVLFSHHRELPLIYMLYNPGGTAISKMFIMIPEVERTSHQRLAVLGDLLSIIIDQRLGREVDLRARAYSDFYVVDKEAGRISSCGPDGQLGTKDDIWLAFDPNVVRF